jgi:hypothetical protein
MFDENGKKLDISKIITTPYGVAVKGMHWR